MQNGIKAMLYAPIDISCNYMLAPLMYDLFSPWYMFHMDNRALCWTKWATQSDHWTRCQNDFEPNLSSDTI